MEKLVDDGLVKSIGISNFSCKKIDTLLSYARIKPCGCASGGSPLLQEPEAC